MHITFSRIKKQYLKANIQPILVVINFDFFAPLRKTTICRGVYNIRSTANIAKK